MGTSLRPRRGAGLSTRVLIILALLAGMAILVAFTVQVLLAAN